MNERPVFTEISMSQFVIGPWPIPALAGPGTAGLGLHSKKGVGVEFSLNLSVLLITRTKIDSDPLLSHLIPSPFGTPLRIWETLVGAASCRDRSDVLSRLEAAPTRQCKFLTRGDEQIPTSVGAASCREKNPLLQRSYSSRLEGAPTDVGIC